MQSSNSLASSTDFDYAKLPSWWIPDEKVDKCSACYTGFGFFFRKVRAVVYNNFSNFQKNSACDQKSGLLTHFALASLQTMWANILLEMHHS